MNRSALSRPVLGALLLAAALGAAGCSKKLTQVDSSFTVPEGMPSANSRLIVFPDVAVGIREYLDRAPVGLDEGDSLLQTIVLYRTGPGVINGVVLDGTPASGYQMLRREANGGLLPLKDFVLTPVVRWLESQWELYSFIDASPGGYNPPTYQGRIGRAHV